jgi:hypothetical protein
MPLTCAFLLQWPSCRQPQLLHSAVRVPAPVLEPRRPAGYSRGDETAQANLDHARGRAGGSRPLSHRADVVAGPGGSAGDREQELYRFNQVAREVSLLRYAMIRRANS